VDYSSARHPWRITYKEDLVLSSKANAADTAEHGQSTIVASDPLASSDEILALVMETLTENKAEDVVQIDLRGKTSVCDHMVICSGRSSRQVAALSEKLADALKKTHGVLTKLEGKETGDWVLIDAGDVVVHVFRPEVRDFYQLEKMWLPAGDAAGDKAGDKA
jgi:ribosome-associated protein